MPVGSVSAGSQNGRPYFISLLIEPLKQWYIEESHGRGQRPYGQPDLVTQTSIWRKSGTDMTDKLTIIEQKEVTFYDDALTAVRTSDGQVYASVRHMCQA